jgi:monoamine oxidase
VLRDLPIRPAVPQPQRAAWRRAGFAANAKLHVPLRAPAGPSAVHAVPDGFWTWTATDGSGAVQPVLHAFGGPAAALDRLGIADGPDGWLARLGTLRPDLDLDGAAAMLTDWPADPLARGSYSAATVRRLPGDDRWLAAPIGRVHLAGEHTAGDRAGLMEGALRSGRRAADEVISRRG